ncbi:MAG: hypothetical protein ACLQD8_07455 [Thermoplasmata archaeon]
MADQATGTPGNAEPTYREMTRERVSRPTLPAAPRRSFLPYVVLVVVTFLITWFAFAAVTGYPVGLGPAPISKASEEAESDVLLSIDNPFDTAQNATADQYAPANFTVPAHTDLEFTIVDFDTGLNPVTPLQASVSGPVANCIYVNSTPSAPGPCEHSLPTGAVGHTFSIVSGVYTGFNVPIPSANGSLEGAPGATVTFDAYFNVTGTYTWQCFAPCDAFSMATDGFMTGTMTVVAP